MMTPDLTPSPVPATPEMPVEKPLEEVLNLDRMPAPSLVAIIQAASLELIRRSPEVMPDIQDRSDREGDVGFDDPKGWLYLADLWDRG